jgi:hypothetical protein
MSNYTVTTNFGAKDSLPTGNAAKLIKGSEFTTEFDNIATAVATKADTASPTFTGTVTIPTANISGGAIVATSLDLADDNKIKLGDGDDLEIYYDSAGSNSIIADVGVGGLQIRGSAVRIKNNDGSEFLANFVEDGAAELYYDNSKKLETVSDGLEVTGTCDITKASNGIISEYRQGSDICASLRVTGGTYPDCTFGNTSVALRFLNNINDQAVAPYNVTNNNAADNLISLGTASARYEDIYATNGTIQTSDQNEKQDIAELSEAEQRVAVACKGLIRKFKWKSAVVSKGSDARYHFGVIAQDVQAAFAAEGLDAGDYGLFISSTWTDEETGQERTRLGVRYSELLAFIIGGL